MVSRILSIFGGVLLWVGISLAATDLTYVEFNTTDMDQLEEKIQSIESQGGRVVHIFPPSVVFVRASAEQIRHLAKDPSAKAAVNPDDPATDGILRSSDYRYKAWRYLVDNNINDELSRSAPGSPLINCVRRFGDSTVWSRESGGETTKGPVDLPDLYTSNYLAGRVAVRVMLMESTGNDENWTSAQIDTTVAEIVEGFELLSQLAAGHGVNISWVYKFDTSVPTNYEPIQGAAMPYWNGDSWVFAWVGNALEYTGNTADWEGAYALVNAMRRTNHANWGYSVIVVMDENDPNHEFSDGYFAYVQPCEDCGRGAPMAIMTYHNDGWQPFGMHEVISHETGHIFGAADEYYDEGYGGCELDDCTRKYGYLWVDNGNCARCNQSPVPCLMNAESTDLCAFTVGHLGWRDTTGDGVCDAIQPDNGGWAMIPNVNPGDIIRIFQTDGEFVTVFGLSADDIFRTPSGQSFAIWNGHNYDNQLAPLKRYYAVTINNGSPFQRPIEDPDPSNTPVFTGINYTNGNLSWNLDESFAYVRCFIYDASNNLIARPIWDKLYAAHYPQSLDMDFLPSGQTYTAKFFGWCPDGGKSQTVNYSFTHQCVHCGDADGSGTVDISDAVFLITYIFKTGTPPADCRYANGMGDANGDGAVDIADAVYLITYIFKSGNPPHCHS